MATKELYRLTDRQYLIERVRMLHEAYRNKAAKLRWACRRDPVGDLDKRSLAELTDDIVDLLKQINRADAALRQKDPTFSGMCSVCGGDCSVGDFECPHCGSV